MHRKITIDETVSAIRIALVVGAVAALVAAASAQDKPRRGDRTDSRKPAPKVGHVAPAFELRTLDGKSEVALEIFRGEKPVVLIFGSYT